MHKFNSEGKPFKVSQKQRWQRRSFNTTVDSYCSTKNIVSNCSFEISPETEKNIENCEIRMLQMRKSLSNSSVDLSVQNILSTNVMAKERNQSKKVRWKSKSKDSEGAFFGDNHLSSYEDKSIITSQKPCFRQKLEENKKNAPLWLVVDPSKTTTTYYDYKFWSNNNIYCPFSNSLPNLHL